MCLVLILAQNESDDDFYGLFYVLVRRVMDGCIPALVIDRGDFYLVPRRPQQVVQLLELLPLNIFVDELFHVLLLLGRVERLELHLGIVGSKVASTRVLVARAPFLTLLGIQGRTRIVTPI